MPAKPGGSSVDVAGQGSSRQRGALTTYGTTLMSFECSSVWATRAGGYQDSLDSHLVSNVNLVQTG